MRDTSSSPAALSPDFGNTRWSLVAALRPDALGQTGAEIAHRRLIELCLHYWYPVYVYLRRSGHAAEAAQRMTTGFFAQLLSDGPHRAAAARTGRFRVFLLGELQRYLAREPHVTTSPNDLAPPMSLEELEARRRAEPESPMSPEQSLERGFALEVIGRARARLRDEARDAGRLPMYEALERYLGSEPQPGDFEAQAQRMGVRPLFVSLAVKRLRQRFRELVEAELSQTVSNADDLEREREALLAALDGARA